MTGRPLNAEAHQHAAELIRLTAEDAARPGTDIVIVVRGHVGAAGDLLWSWDSWWKPAEAAPGG